MGLVQWLSFPWYTDHSNNLCELLNFFGIAGEPEKFCSLKQQTRLPCLNPPVHHIYFVARQILSYSACPSSPRHLMHECKVIIRGNSTIYISDFVFQICTEEIFLHLIQYECKERNLYAGLPCPPPHRKRKAKQLDTQEGMGRQFFKFTKSLQAFQKSSRKQNEHTPIKISLGAYPCL